MPSTLNDYEVIASIGSGSYGSCKKIRRKRDGKILVWKELEYGGMCEAEKKRLVTEVNILREFKHPHIVRYYDRIIEHNKAKLYIVMEHCEGGDIDTLIKQMKREGRTFDEEVIWKMCYQIILALKECHGKNFDGKTVLHRDLKPANIFLDQENNVKLGDFGLARVLSSETSFATTFIGTPYYMSPEQMKFDSYDEKSDIWSLGCLLFEMCSLRPPFMAHSTGELVSKICVGNLSRIPFRYSDELNRLINSMLCVQSVHRPSHEDLLTHPALIKYANDTRSNTPNPHKEAMKKWEEKLHIKEKELDERERKFQEQNLERKLEIKKLKSLEKQLALKEKELELKQRDILTREKLVDKKIAKANKLMREACANNSENKENPVGILKKQVTFLTGDNKDNDWYSMGLPEDLASPIDTSTKLDTEYVHNKIDIRAKLRQEKKGAMF